MDYGRQVDELLEELAQSTGIQFEIAENKNSDEATAKTLSKLVRRFKGDSSRGYFFQQFLLGELTSEEVLRKRKSLRLERNAPWVLFLVHFKQPYEEYVVKMLSSLFSAASDYVVEIDPVHIALIRQTRLILSDEKLSEIAVSIVDLLSTEAMLSVHVAYDRVCKEFGLLKQAFTNCQMALKIGTLFHSSSNVIGYHDLGIGKLVYSLPKDICREYLEDHLNGFDFATLDRETQNTISVFFGSGLSIAETARSLYIHRNTLVYRLDKFEKQSGLDIRHFEDAVTCQIAMLMTEYLRMD